MRVGVRVRVRARVRVEVRVRVRVSRVRVNLGAGGGGAQPQLGLAASHRGQRRHRAHRVFPAEGGDLDGQREAGPQAVAQLGLVHDDDELLGAHLHVSE